MNSTKRRIFLILGIILMLFLHVNCEKKNLPDKPIIEPSDEVILLMNEKLVVRANAKYAQDYEWKLIGNGQISSNSGDTIIYTAPNSGNDTAVIQVQAKNNNGVSPSISLVVKIQAIKTIKIEALGIPAGWMSGGGKPENYINFGNSPNGGRNNDSCLEFIYKPGGNWGGIIWWPLLCGSSGVNEAWDRVRENLCSINVLQQGNFKKINNLTFWAKGKKGTEILEFKVGANDIMPKPGRSTGKISLSNKWEQYSIDLVNLDLTNSIGLFMWIAADEDNLKEINFYLADIQLEGI